MNDRWRKEYEEAFCKLVGAEGARAFGLGRQALVILLKALGVNAGDKVGVCSFTCLSVAETVEVCGAIPVYLDVDDHLCIEPQEIMQQHPGSLKVVILQHTFGVPGRLEELLSACAKIGAKVVEDCAQAVGCFWKGVPLGRFGEGAIYSFQWGKPYTTGQGGMVTVNSTALLEEIDKHIANLALPMSGISDLILCFQRQLYFAFAGTRYASYLKSAYCRLREKGLASGSFKLGCDFSLFPGYIRLAGNRMSAAGLKQLKNWPENQKLRRHNTELIKQAFDRAGLPLWPLPPEADITMLRYPLLASDKSQTLEQARKNGVDIAGWYMSPVHPLQGEDLAKVDYRTGSCQRAENMISQLVHLPTGLGLNKQHLEAMMRIIPQN